MAVDSMLRRANKAQAGIRRLHDQALVGAQRSRVGIPFSPGLPPSLKLLWTGRRTGWLGLAVCSKPDDPPSLPPSLKLWWTGKLRRTGGNAHRGKLCVSAKSDTAI